MFVKQTVIGTLCFQGDGDVVSDLRASLEQKDEELEQQTAAYQALMDELQLLRKQAGQGEVRATYKYFTLFYCHTPYLTFLTIVQMGESFV